jgi:Flp pilus assembly protein TadD
VVVPFLPALGNGFVWDDDENLVTNPAYRGLGWPQLRWMLTTVHVGHFIPVTWVSFALDYLVWGMNPLGYHLTNLLLHAANAVLLALVARRLLAKAAPGLSGPAREAGSLLAALFFAVHPLRAESVAWVTERRDVLSGLCFLATVLLYLAAADAEGRRRIRLLALSVGAYALALASKSLVMTLPVVLVLLDVYPLRRIGGPVARGVWLEKLPYVALSLAAAGMSYYGAVFGTSLGAYPWPTRIYRTVYTVWFFFIKTLLPTGLSPLYEIPARPSLLDARFLASLIGCAAVAGALLLLRRRWPGALAAAVFYLVVLAPVSGLVVSSGLQLAADRYSYLSCLGWAVLVGAGGAWLVRRRERGALAPAAAALAAGAVVLGLVALGALTWRQVQVWRDTPTLWRHALAVNPQCAACENNLGVWQMRQGDPAAALEHFRRADVIRPDRFPIHVTNMGLALAKLGRLPEAIQQYTLVLAREPTVFDVRAHLVTALWRSGRQEEAVEQLREAVRVAPESVVAHGSLGTALLAVGRAGEAVVHLQRAVELNPAAAAPRLALVQAYAALGRADLAREQYEVLKTLDPRLAAQVSAGSLRPD